MTKYQVLENGRSADWKLCEKSIVRFSKSKKKVSNKFKKKWATSIFNSFEEALLYARKWLGAYGGSDDGRSGIELKLNESWDYSGYGSMIEIREIK